MVLCIHLTTNHKLASQIQIRTNVSSNAIFAKAFNSMMMFLKAICGRSEPLSTVQTRAGGGSGNEIEPGLGTRLGLTADVRRTHVRYQVEDGVAEQSRRSQGNHEGEDVLVEVGVALEAGHQHHPG